MFCFINFVKNYNNLICLPKKYDKYIHGKFKRYLQYLPMKCVIQLQYKISYDNNKIIIINIYSGNRVKLG